MWSEQKILAHILGGLFSPAAVRGDRATAGDVVGAGRIVAPSLLLMVRPVGVVSEKSAARVAVPSLDVPRWGANGLFGAAEEGSGGKQRTGFHRGRNAGAKLQIPG
jgi:hypothetical protein